MSLRGLGSIKRLEDDGREEGRERDKKRDGGMQLATMACLRCVEAVSSCCIGLLSVG